MASGSAKLHRFQQSAALGVAKNEGSHFSWNGRRLASVYPRFVPSFHEMWWKKS